VLLNRLYLRNFRVYEDELDLDLPPGLVGIYGPNGSGKSTLLEAILFTLWGRSRTAKHEIRSSGVGGDCIAEISFEHEGHLYVVRRSLSGINATVRAEAHADGLLMAAGVRETGRYVHSVLGMDDIAFRASVFAEQKQLAAFSSQSPAERRRLVLQLLGITPLDAARDAARRDARDTSEQHRRLRELLPDLDALAVAADDADARAGAAEAAARIEEDHVAVLRCRAEEAGAALAGAETGRHAYEALVREGKTARGELDRINAVLSELTIEAAQLDTAAARLVEVEQAAADLEIAEALHAALSTVVQATQIVHELQLGPEPPVADGKEHDRSVVQEGEARDAVSSLRGRTHAAAGEVSRAAEQNERSSGLSDEAACPLCGQALGAAFAAVRAHRADELAEAVGRLDELKGQRAEWEVRAAAASAARAETARQLRRAEATRSAWEQTSLRRQEAETALRQARAAVEQLPRLRGLPNATESSLPELTEVTEGLLPEDLLPEDLLPEDLASLEAARHQIASRVRVAGDARVEADRLRGRLERREASTVALAAARAGAEQAQKTVDDLLLQVKRLDFDPARLLAAKDAHRQAQDLHVAADRTARGVREAAVRERARAEGDARRLVDAKEQHAALATIRTDARHLNRLADLLAEFRNTVVASVGPRLAVQAAELFGELTDHEYDELRVDAETFELQISDAGRIFGLDRFSGSEIDLANLALRVAIGEHVRFQSGGSVGLLVLDEVFGPLDEERKVRMLGALERLRGRFRQVLVVTHDNEIKDQLPSAIEVIKLPGRRATARLVGV